MAENYAIELRGITKTFGSVVANNNINLNLKQGEILALLGENGSGKTTLMNMLSGIYQPDKGQIFMNGKEVTLDSPAIIENSRTYLPVRFVAETLGATVAWDGATSTATITK